LSKKSIARELDLDIKTVRKWCRQSWVPQRRRSRGRMLASWEEFLRGRAPEVGFNGAVLHRELVEKGCLCSYSAVVKHVKPWREAWRGGEVPTLRFETGPGEQAQVDWGSTWVYLGEEPVRVHLFVMVLGFSRRLFVQAYLSEGLGPLLDGHSAAFAHFGGRTRTILYDNPRTIVSEKDEATGRVVWNATFKDRMDFYGLEIRLCRYYRAQTKGKVESGVKYVKRNALAGRRFHDLEELNRWLLQWCLTVADERVHGTTHERPSQRFLRETLIGVDLRSPSPRERVESRVVPRDGYVVVETNRYPVPLDWVGQRVQVRIQREAIWIHGEPVEPVEHARLGGKYQVARWHGAPRQVPPRRSAQPAGGPPRFDPVFLGELGEVETRALHRYERLLEEVAS
ncbi:MAG TPA: IS21 family transposase, partial [Thermoanaerobaculia bacterium]|nr:IS21 family transposase [Thermoanaerobaculia bacterium]